MTTYVCPEKDAACEEFGVASRCRDFPTLKKAAMTTEPKMPDGGASIKLQGVDPYPAKPERAELSGCACRWDKEDNRVQTCERHQGWLDVVHEWAERSKAAEAALLSAGPARAIAMPNAANPPMGYVSVIDVEKLLCEKLGIQWSATGISIVSLIDRLAAVPDAAKPATACDPTKTECPRCKNNIAACDGVFAAKPEQQTWEEACGASRQNFLAVAARIDDPSWGETDPEIRALAEKAVQQSESAKPEPCKEKDNDYACKNRHQCWEPCGELGHSEEHARPAPKETQDAVNAALGLAAKPAQQPLTDEQCDMVIDASGLGPVAAFMQNREILRALCRRAHGIGKDQAS